MKSTAKRRGPAKRKPKRLSAPEVYFSCSMMGLQPAIGERGWKEAEIARLIDNGN